MSESLSIFRLYCGYMIISPLLFALPFSLSPCFSQGIDEASSKDKWVLWPQFVLCGQLLLFKDDWQTITVVVLLQNPLLALSSQFEPSTNSILALSHPVCRSLGQLPPTDTQIHKQIKNTQHTVTYCFIHLLAAVFKRPWTLRMRWTSFLDGPSMLAASTSWGKIMSRSFCSLFKQLTLRKRSVI